MICFLVVVLLSVIFVGRLGCIARVSLAINALANLQLPLKELGSNFAQVYCQHLLWNGRIGSWDSFSLPRRFFFVNCQSQFQVQELYQLLLMSPKLRLGKMNKHWVPACLWHSLFLFASIRVFAQAYVFCWRHSVGTSSAHELCYKIARDPHQSTRFSTKTEETKSCTMITVCRMKRFCSILQGNRATMLRITGWGGGGWKLHWDMTNEVIKRDICENH